MSDERKSKKKRTRWSDEPGDLRTADFLARRLEAIRDDLSDLIPDIQSLHDFGQLPSIGWVIQSVKQLHRKYHKRASGFTWTEELSE
jgi:hypothetical protein